MRGVYNDSSVQDMLFVFAAGAATGAPSPQRAVCSGGPHLGGQQAPWRGGWRAWLTFGLRCACEHGEVQPAHPTRFRHGAGNQAKDLDAAEANKSPISYPAALARELNNLISVASCNYFDVLLQPSDGTPSNFGKTLISLAAPALAVLGPGAGGANDAVYNL